MKAETVALYILGAIALYVVVDALVKARVIPEWGGLKGTDPSRRGEFE
jgi:hypothetical protein